MRFTQQANITLANDIDDGDKVVNVETWLHKKVAATPMERTRRERRSGSGQRSKTIKSSGSSEVLCVLNCLSPALKRPS
jgi:hypothetical protein